MLWDYKNGRIGLVEIANHVKSSNQGGFNAVLYTDSNYVVSIHYYDGINETAKTKVL